jgi:DNA-binding transcriptional MerR regulator
MGIEKVKGLLQQLQEELKKTNEAMDEQTVQQLQKLDENIHQILNAENLEQQDLYDGIMHMEYDFLTKHPVASGIMREMVDILSKAGI